MVLFMRSVGNLEYNLWQVIMILVQGIWSLIWTKLQRYFQEACNGLLNSDQMSLDQTNLFQTGQESGKVKYWSFPITGSPRQSCGQFGIPSDLLFPQTITRQHYPEDLACLNFGNHHRHHNIFTRQHWRNNFLEYELIFSSHQRSSTFHSFPFLPHTVK